MMAVKLIHDIKECVVGGVLQVIPQLIARIDTPRSLVGRLVHQLLVDIGKAHPQVCTGIRVLDASPVVFYTLSDSDPRTFHK